MRANQHDHENADTGGSSRPPDSAAVADDVLLGASTIAKHITSLGFPVDEDDVYYLHRAKKWPFNKYGVFLIASKRRLTRHAKKLLDGSPA